MSTCSTNFAKSGDLNGPGSPDQPVYEYTNNYQAKHLSLRAFRPTPEISRERNELFDAETTGRTKVPHARTE
jgi:hypothetical protein